ncbi:MAG: ABC transporter substrate-binding protein [Enterobacterales bacterium]|nr:ABC transporter substrate-binding protein [Enterobacterales bacterium]
MLAQLNERRTEFTETPSRLIDYAKGFALTHWDIKRTSRLILGPYWRKANAEQRQAFQDEYLKTLLRYVIRAYGYYDDSLLEVVAYDWKPLRTGGWVLSKIRIPAGVTVAVDYRMILDKNTNQWRLIDVRAEGISLVNVKRTEYRQVAKRDGIDGLLTLMSDKNDKVLQPILVSDTE